MSISKIHIYQEEDAFSSLTVLMHSEEVRFNLTILSSQVEKMNYLRALFAERVGIPPTIGRIIEREIGIWEKVREFDKESAWE